MRLRIIFKLIFSSLSRDIGLITSYRALNKTANKILSSRIKPSTVPTVNLFSNPLSPIYRPRSKASDTSLLTYTPPADLIIFTISMISDSRYIFLTQFDIIFLIDDSGSMAG